MNSLDIYNFDFINSVISKIYQSDSLKEEDYNKIRKLIASKSKYHFKFKHFESLNINEICNYLKYNELESNSDALDIFKKDYQLQIGSGIKFSSQNTIDQIIDPNWWKNSKFVFN